MTAQISDELVVDGQRYAIAGVSGGPLFEPTDHGIESVMISTACYRGYYVAYEATDLLRVIELTVGVDDGVEPPALQGRPAVPSNFGGWTYQGLALPVKFTGGLLGGDGFLRELYVHMGFHPVWKYEKVVEVLFDDGAVVGVLDRSAEMAALRRRCAGRDSPGPEATRSEIEAFVKRAFSLEYPDFLQ